MESNEARDSLDVADEARRRLTAGLRLPAGFSSALATAVAVQVGAAAYGIAAQTVTGVAVALAGAAVFLGVAAFLLHRFSRVNGVRVDGLASQVVLVAGARASIVYLGALAVGIVAAFDSRWWLVGAASVAAGVGCALGARRWWRGYQHDPAAHTAGASPRVLAVLGVAAALGCAALLVLG